MQTPFPEDKIPFDGLGELMGLEVLLPCADDAPYDSRLIPASAVPSDAAMLYRTRWLEVYREHVGGPFLVCGIRTPKFPAEAQMNLGILWYMTLAMGCLHAMQRGEQAVLCHCTLLETDAGGVLLFGESGVGKSTLSARWRAYGGKCISDDMALLDFSDPEGRVYVRRMPTWSAVREGRSEWNYPCSEEIPLIGVYALGRSESGHDEVVPIPYAQYYAQCYRSIFYWTLLFAERLRTEEQPAIVETIRGFTDRITRDNPSVAFLASLEGDPRPVIETCLRDVSSKTRTS